MTRRLLIGVAALLSGAALSASLPPAELSVYAWVGLMPAYRPSKSAAVLSTNAFVARL